MYETVKCYRCESKENVTQTPKKCRDETNISTVVNWTSNSARVAPQQSSIP